MKTHKHDGPPAALSVDEVLHELRVHQTELEAQNEELRRTLAELDTSRARYFDFYDMAPVGYCTVDGAGLIRQANLTAGALLGLPRASLLQKPITDFILSLDQDSFYLLRQRIKSSGEHQQCELRLKKENAFFWAHLDALATTDEDGVAVLRIVLTDVSVRKQSELDLAQSLVEKNIVLERMQQAERFAQNTVDAISASLAILDANGTIVSVNRAWRQLASANECDLCQVGEGVNYLSICDAVVGEDTESANEIAAGIRAVLAGQQDSFILEYPCHSANEKRWFIASVTRFKGEGATRLVVLHQDISELKRANLERDRLIADVQYHEARWSNAAESLGEGFWEWDISSGEMLRSRVFDTVLGYGEQELPLTAEAWVELIHPDDLANNVTCLQNYLTGKSSTYAIEMRLRSKDGNYRWIACRGTGIARDAAGAPTRMIGMHTDITERKQMELALARQHQLLHDVVENLPFGLVVYDKNRQVILFNTSFPIKLNIPSGLMDKPDVCFDDIIRLNFERGDYQEQDFDRVLKFVAMLEGGQPVSFERIQHDGTWLEIHGNSLSDGGHLLTYSNITERKKVEDELVIANDELTFQNEEKNKHAAELLAAYAETSTSENNFRFILENSPIAIRMTSKATGLLVFVNKRYCDLTEHSAEELIGADPAQFHLAQQDDNDLDSMDGVESKLIKLMSHNKISWALTSGIEMEFEGELIYLGWFYEVTKLKELEHALLDSQERLNLSFEGSGDGMWDWNVVTNAVNYSKQWKSMLGYDESELKDDFKEWEIRVHPEDLAKGLSDIQAYLNGKTPRYVNEHRLRCKDGSYKWILTRGMITSRDANGNPLRLIGTHTDITSQKNTEHALLVAQLASDKANLAKSKFLAAASHDLRQPLTALSLYVDVLTRHSNDENVELGMKIQSCVSSLSELLDNLLKISKLDAGVVVPIQSVFSIDDILDSIININITAANLKGIHLHVRPSRLVVHTDQTILKRILGNLIANAIRYTNTGGVLIGCRHHDGKWWVEVWDSGVGFPSNMGKHIFEEFTQLGDNSRRVGSGLGLAIVSKSAALLGLELRAYSRLGRGSMFAIEIPQSETPLIKALAEPKVLTHKWRIALVDDNSMVLNATYFALTAIGHEVIIAASELEILKKLDHQSVDILISDYRLADNKTGLELILNVRARFENGLPAILITGDTDPKLIQLFDQHKIKVSYKPLKIDALTNMINEVLLND